MLVAICLDQNAVPCGYTLVPLTLIHSAVSLEHPAVAMSHIVFEIAPVLNATAPELATHSFFFAFDERALELSHWLGRAVHIHVNELAFDVALNSDGNRPLTCSVLLPLMEDTLVHAAIQAN